MKSIIFRVFSLIIVLSVLCSLLALSSCKNVDSGEDNILFTDALGREVSVKKNPSRVAALLGSFADVWTLSGGELCASSEDGWDDFGLDLEGAVNIGGAHSPSLELLVSADPELVIASASTASNVDMREPLEAMGITVVYFDVKSFDDYLDMLNVCTDITGRKDLYEKNGLAVKEKIDLIKSRYAESDIPEEDRKILLLRVASGFVKAKGSHGTVLGEMLCDIGCINIADSNRDLLENLSIEVIIRENPRHIFAVTMGNDTEAAQKSLEKLMKENSAWSTLDAVKSGRLHMMDKRLFNLKPNARWAESYEILYDKLTKK